MDYWRGRKLCICKGNENAGIFATKVGFHKDQRRKWALQRITKVKKSATQ